MQVATDYRWVKWRDWRLVCQAGLWNSELQKRILKLVEQQSWAKHPQTLTVAFSSGGRDSELFLKIFHPRKGGGSWRNCFQRSKALRAWSQGTALLEAGFLAPVTVAAGERRRFGVLQRGFALSEKVSGQGAPFFLRDLFDSGSDRDRVKVKRAGLGQLAATIRRFHDSGFVHGDLVATNIFVCRDTDAHLRFVFMDNDRTRRYPPWLPQTFWKRNLVQLNRLPLPGITLQDRMRFFHAYLGQSRLTAAEIRLARWLEQRTRQRRQECDGVSRVGGFRELMRWSGN